MNANELRIAGDWANKLCDEASELGRSLPVEFTEAASAATNALWVLRERLRNAAYSLEHPEGAPVEGEAAIEELRKSFGL